MCALIFRRGDATEVSGHQPETHWQLAIFSSWRRVSDDEHRYGGLSRLAADSSVTDRLFLSAAVAHEIWFPRFDASDRHMVADVYRLRRDARSVTEMRDLRPVKRVCLAQLDITPRSFLEGFPGIGSTVEWFGLDIRFTVTIADDGAILSIDDENVIDNDGIHAPTPVATRVKLEKGPHNFRVRYFQGPGPDLALMLAWKKPGAADYGYVPRSLIGRPPAGTLKAHQPKG